MLRSFVILKGLKKPPKCNIPSNLHVGVSKSGNMDKNLMKECISLCYNQKGTFKSINETLLILDNYGSHKEETVV